jgi:hypothetical protein
MQKKDKNSDCFTGFEESYRNGVEVYILMVISGSLVYLLSCAGGLGCFQFP